MMPPMYHTVHKVTSTRNAYGDFIAGTEVPLKAHVRIIEEQVTGQANEAVQCDAMMWFEPDSGVQRQDIIKFQDTYYRVERYTEARKLRDPNIQFIKTELLKYGDIS